MTTPKTATPIFCIDPGLSTAVHQECRSIVNMMEVWVRDFYGRHIIEITGEFAGKSET